MSWIFNYLADYLWVPSVAYANDHGLGVEFLAQVYALNLGARFLPNLLITQWGSQIEYWMMAFVSFGYAISFLHPTQVWAFDLMALSSGMGFVRACLTVHVQACFQDNPEMFTTISKHCGAARNCGSIAAMIVPALLYQHFGWKAVCCGAAAAALLYILLSCLVRRLESPASREAVSEFEPHVEGTCTDISWIDWMVGSAFIVTELQYNIGNAAIPQTLTSTFIMSVGAVGPTLGSFNATSMIFLALLPTIPWVLLHRSPLNILMSFFLVLVSGLLAAFSALAPDHGLPLFITSILSFTLAINMAQVLMLEYLSGVLDTKGVEKLMGVSETFGCGFAMLGGYVGEELKVFGSSAPFLMQCFVALVTVTTLGASFAHRHVTREDLDAEAGAAGAVRPGFAQLMEGIQRLCTSDEKESLALLERRYRQRRAIRGGPVGCGDTDGR